MKSKKEGFTGERQVKLPPMIVDTEEHDTLTTSLYITDIGYYPKAEYHHCTRWQAINQYVLIYCVDGNGWYKVDNKTYSVKSNQYFILPKGKPHEYGADEHGFWTIYWIHFNGDHASIYADGAELPHDINVAINSRISDRIDIFEEILTTLQWQKDIEDLRYASSLLHHFLASMRYLTQFRSARNAKEKAEFVKDEDNIVDAAKHYMMENIENKIKLNDVLDYIGYSPSYFNSLFKKSTGNTPLQYINHLKVEQACKLLRTTNLKINQICYKIGIEDQLYFSRLFKKTTGMTPSEYRQQNKK